MPAAKVRSIKLGHRQFMIDAFARDQKITFHAAMIALIDRGLGTVTLPERPDARQFLAHLERQENAAKTTTRTQPVLPRSKWMV